MCSQDKLQEHSVQLSHLNFGLASSPRATEAFHGSYIHALTLHKINP